MKAYRQITFQREHRLVWSYSALLVIAGIFLMMRPVLAQDRKPVPDVRVDVKEEFDSTWQDLGVDLHDFLPRNFDGSGFYGIPPGPPMHRFWHWNGEDSTAYSYLEDFFDEEFLEDIRNGFNIPRQLWLIPADTMGYSQHDGGPLRDPFKHDCLEQLRDLEERMEEYRQEHRQLMEKYFPESLPGGSPEPGIQQERMPGTPASTKLRKSGKV